MKIFTKKVNKLQEAIDTKALELINMDIGDPNFDTEMEKLERLIKLKEQSDSKKISPDTLAIVVGNLVGIGLILNYEKAGIVTSKAISFVLKGRV